jgi:hypothetical protein
MPALFIGHGSPMNTTLLWRVRVRAGIGLHAARTTAPRAQRSRRRALPENPRPRLAEPPGNWRRTLERPARPALAKEVGDLLRRYPALEPRESERLLESFKALTLLDLAMMTSDESLRAPLDAFRRDHKRQLRPPSGSPYCFSECRFRC